MICTGLGTPPLKLSKCVPGERTTTTIKTLCTEPSWHQGKWEAEHSYGECSGHVLIYSIWCINICNNRTQASMLSVQPAILLLLFTSIVHCALCNVQCPPLKMHLSLQWFRSKLVKTQAASLGGKKVQRMPNRTGSSAQFQNQCPHVQMSAF